MKRVQIYTNMDERCGNAQYARDLEEQLLRWYLVARGTTWNDEADVYIVNWHPGVVHVSVDDVRRLHASGRKVIIIHQNSTEAGEAELFNLADAVVVHESVKSSRPLTWIQHPVPVTTPGKVKVQPKIGTCGFPFPWKRFDVAAEAASRIGFKFLAIAPISRHMDTSAQIRQLHAKMNGQAEIVREWMPTSVVVDRLKECMVNIFWFQSQAIEDELGQTGSARMAVAAQRPMIISRHRKFRTMIESYATELYIADREEDVYDLVKEITMSAKPARCPLQQYRETNWRVAGERYRDMIQEVLAC